MAPLPINDSDETDIIYIFDDADLRHRRYRLGYLLSTIKAYSNEEQPKPETKALTDKARPKPLALKPAKPLRPADPPISRFR